MPGNRKPRDAPLAVRLDPEAATALDTLCAQWRCGKAEAVRRALGEAVAGGEALRPVMEAPARINSRPGADARALGGPRPCQ